MLKKIGVSFILIVILVCSCLAVSGCSSKTDEIEKYDLSIKIGQIEIDENGNRRWWDILNEWVFTPDIDEIYTEIPYDGKKNCFCLLACNMPDHPEYGDKWFGISNASWENEFGYPLFPQSSDFPFCMDSLLCYWRPYGNTGFMKPNWGISYADKAGIYSFTVNATKSIWNERKIKLVINFTEPQEPDLEPEEGYEENHD